MSVNILDPELPFLASQAAVELDSVLQGRPTDVQSVHQLAERLKSALDFSAPGQAPRALLADTATVTILGQALDQSNQGMPLSTVDDLLRRTDELVSQLATAQAGAEQAELEWSRAFCLALSRCAAAYRKSIYDIRQPHPFRR